MLELIDFGINKAKRSNLENNVTKKTKLNSKRINKYSGLNKKQEFILEKTCLEKLNNNFKCLCQINVISIRSNVIKIINCGISLNNYKNIWIKNKEIISLLKM